MRCRKNCGFLVIALFVIVALAAVAVIVAVTIVLSLAFNRQSSATSTLPRSDIAAANIPSSIQYMVSNDSNRSSVKSVIEHLSPILQGIYWFHIEVDCNQEAKHVTATTTDANAQSRDILQPLTNEFCVHPSCVSSSSNSLIPSGCISGVFSSNNSFPFVNKLIQFPVDANITFSNVIFSVARDTSVTTRTQDPISFPQVLLNNGSGWKSNVFIIPKSKGGVYMFSVSATACEPCELHIVVTTKRKTEKDYYLLVHWDTRSKTACVLLSRSIIVILEAGDRAEIQINNGKILVDKDHLMTFMGFHYNPKFSPGVAWSAYAGSLHGDWKDQKTSFKTPIDFKTGHRSGSDLKGNILEWNGEGNGLVSGIYYLTYTVTYRSCCLSVVLYVNDKPVSCIQQSISVSNYETRQRAVLVQLNAQAKLQLCHEKGTLGVLHSKYSVGFSGMRIA